MNYRPIFLPVLLCVSAPVWAGADKAGPDQVDYQTTIAAMGEYRSHAEAVVLEAKKKWRNTSPEYNECRDRFARAEQTVEVFLAAVSTSIEQGSRNRSWTPSADAATRAAERLFACVQAEGAGARMVPIPPFVDFAIAFIEHFLFKSKKQRGMTEVVEVDLRWKSWDRIR